MTENTVKTNYKKKYSTHLSKEDYQLWQKWKHAKHEPHQYFARRQIEKQLRHKGYGYLVGDLPKKGEVSKDEFKMILKYRQLLHQRDKEGAQLVRQSLRAVGLGAFAGDYPSQEKPSLKERIFTAENIVAFSNAINAPVLGFLDTEFTTQRHEILSIGCVLYDTKTKQTYTFYQTVKPVYEKKLSNRCIELTHLTQKEINASPSFVEVIEQFQHFLELHQASYLMTWGNSDHSSIKTSFSYARMSLKKRDAIVSKLIDIQPIISLLRDETRLQFSLQDMKEYYHIHGKVEHHALQDAIDLKNIILTFKNSYPMEG